MNETLSNELADMATEDWQLRAELAVGGALYEGYHPRMEAMQRAHGVRLSAILDEHGWPGHALVGEDGAEAAWRIAQHAISMPELQRRALALLREASAKGEAKASHWAKLEDRVRVQEGRPQLFGTQFDWDESGRMSPLPIEDPGGVDARRRAVGLAPMEETIRRHRRSVDASNERPPADWRERQLRLERWARETGWRGQP